MAAASLLILVAALSATRPTDRELTWADGRPLDAIGGDDEPSIASLSDGSSIRLSPKTALTVLENGGHEISFLFHGGRAVFSVRPHGSRRWSIECGLATIQVTGTEFTITRSPAALIVAVASGVVLVRGERVPERVRRLGNGETIEISALPVLPEKGEAEVGTLRARVIATLRAQARNDTPREPPRHSDPVPVAVRPSEEEGHAAEDLSDPVRSDSELTAGDLLMLADAARLQGEDLRAQKILEHFLHLYSDEDTAPAAAFTLGRLRLEKLNDPRGAAAAFRSALALGISKPLHEDTLAYLARSEIRAGDGDAARAAARKYVEHYPQGRAIAEMRTLAR